MKQDTWLTASELQQLLLQLLKGRRESHTQSLQRSKVKTSYLPSTLRTVQSINWCIPSADSLAASYQAQSMNFTYR